MADTPFQLHPDLERVMYSEEQIHQKVQEIANQLNEEYKDKNPLCICILKGAVVFYTDLVRACNFPIQMDFMIASSYGAGTTHGKLIIKKDTSADISGRHVLIIEDIIDSGNTLSMLKKELSQRNPASVKIVTLLDKKARRETPIEPDFYGFSCENEFVVGYGLDYNEIYRNLPYIGILKREIYE